MAKRPPMGGVTRKHLARAERERIQRRWILAGTILTISLVVGLLAYGWYDSRFVQPKIVIAEVNGETITKAEFQGRVRLMQRQLLTQLNSYAQMESFFASDPNTLSQIRSLQSQIQAQLSDVEFLGRDVIDQVILDKLIIQEAMNRGIEVSQAEVQRRIEEDFGLYVDGTPTPLPTFTPFPTFTPDVTATAAAALTATPGASPTAAPTRTPRPSPTAYTVDAFEREYKEFMDSLSDFRIREEDYLAFVEAQLYREKLQEAYEPELPSEQEQVLIKQIIVPDLETGEEVLERLEAGEDWADLVIEFSQDPSAGSEEGSLGWRTLGELLTAYGQAGVAAFGTAEGEVSGPFQTEFGWHLFQVEERAERPLSDEARSLVEEQAYSNFLNTLRQEAEITINEEWVDHLPQPVAATGP
ncbi:MAG: peptidylprolyl isomerase [Anaerolineales bacterium]|nr:peptidylprolyl isomerase [Anaerolineales bacterium]